MCGTFRLRGSISQLFPPPHRTPPEKRRATSAKHTELARIGSFNNKGLKTFRFDFDSPFFVFCVSMLSLFFSIRVPLFGRHSRQESMFDPVMWMFVYPTAASKNNCPTMFNVRPPTASSLLALFDSTPSPLLRKEMLRRTQPTRLLVPHTKPTQPKHMDKPGVWGPAAGPDKDTLGKRMYFYRIKTLMRIGQLVSPFKTKKAVWLWRRTQTRVWKVSVFILVCSALVAMGNLWVLMMFYSTNVGPSTPTLERKVREHRLSKQILQMVRERERDLVTEQEQMAAAAQMATISAKK
jgi:hypothetical protein